FLFLLPRLPHDALFPYTTLFRSVRRRRRRRRQRRPGAPPDALCPTARPPHRDAEPRAPDGGRVALGTHRRPLRRLPPGRRGRRGDRKSTRLNSSHVSISYAVFCL